MRSTPIHLLVILAAAAAIELGLGGSTLALLTAALVVVFASMVVFAQAAPKAGTQTAPPGVAQGPKPSNEAEAARSLLVGAYAATLLVAGVSLGLADIFPAVAFGLLLLTAAWIAAWWPASTRMYSLSTTTDINRDPATVFAFFADLRNGPRYYYMYEQSCEKLGDAPIGLGTEFRAQLIFRAGKVPNVKEDTSFDHVERIVEFEPNHRLAVCVVTGLSPNLGTYTIEPIAEGSRVTYRYDHLHSFPSCFFASRLTAGSAYRFMRATRLAAWTRAKQILEGTEIPRVEAAPPEVKPLPRARDGARYTAAGLLVILAIQAVWIVEFGYMPDRLAALFTLLSPALVLLGASLILNRRALPPSTPQSDQPAAQDAEGSLVVVAPGQRVAGPPRQSRWAGGGLTPQSAAILVGGVSLALAVISPNLALAVLLIAAGWVVYWAPQATRRYVLSSTVVIDRDAGTVFAFVSDATNAPKYQYTYDLTVEKLTPGPIGVGTRFGSHVNLRAGIDPVRHNFTRDGIEEILEFEPNRKLVSTVTSGRQDNRDVTTFDEVPGGTRVTQRFEYLFSYSGAVLGARLRNGDVDRRLQAKRVVHWNRAKEILEGRQPVTP